MIDHIIAQANEETSIRAVILVGSRASGNAVDALSDYDLSIFSKNSFSYTNADQWLATLGNIWVRVNEKVYFEDKQFPTRLTIFEGGLKVDFAFFPLNILHNIVNSPFLPFEYDMGYSVLLDKDSLTANMRKPAFKGYSRYKPTEQEFFNIINEFWFEAYHVAVYLKRGELWSAKARADSIHHNFLLKMIEWNELAKHSWNYIVPPQGKKMPSWTSESTWKALQSTSAHFDEQDGWKGLVNTMNLFRNLATETAQMLGYSYPEDIDSNISTFILKLRS